MREGRNAEAKPPREIFGDLWGRIGLGKRIGHKRHKEESWLGFYSDGKNQILDIRYWKPKNFVSYVPFVVNS